MSGNRAKGGCNQNCRMTRWQTEDEVQHVIDSTLKSVSDFSLEEPKSGSVGIPTAWAIGIIDSLTSKNFPNDPLIKKIGIRVPSVDSETLISSYPTRKTLWYLADLVRKTDSPSCYNTEGCLCDITGEIINETKKWGMRPFYKKFLIEFSKICEVHMDCIIAYDMTMRVKRSRFNNPERSITSPSGRSFIFAFYDKGTQPGGFLEITRTDDELPFTGVDNVNYHGPKCETCNNFKKLFLCGRCRIVRYCSREHQISDWNNHKLVCNKQ